MEIVIRRKPADPQVGMKYLPLTPQLREEIVYYRRQIDQMVQNKHNVCVEDIQALVFEISQSEVEFPRHLLKDLFIMVNEKIAMSIETEHLYSLEILVDTLQMMNARNIEAE